MQHQQQHRLRRILLVAACAALLLAPSTDGHATMTNPKPRQVDPLRWFQVGCLIGCTCAGKGKEQYPTFEGYGGASALGCSKPMEPTNNLPEFRTFNAESKSEAGDWTRYFPWRAPGSAKPLDACSIASGFKQGEESFSSTVPGFANGARGSELSPGTVTYMPAGGTFDAQFGLLVNHGGGYQYRLCPKSSALSEDCFQQNPLSFASSKQIIRKADGSEIEISATDISQGTSPAGSTWRRIPTPACNCDAGTGCTDAANSGGKSTFSAAYSTGTPSSAAVSPNCPHGLQYEAQHLTDGTWPEGYGYYMETLEVEEDEDGAGETKSESGGKAVAESDACGVHSSDEAACKGTTGCAFFNKVGKDYCYTAGKKRRAGGDYLSRDYGRASFTIVDRLTVPQEEGSYVLSWRWDCEQTPQIWITCADVEVRDKGDPVFSQKISGSARSAAMNGCFTYVAVAVLLRALLL